MNTHRIARLVDITGPRFTVAAKTALSPITSEVNDTLSALRATVYEEMSNDPYWEDVAEEFLHNEWSVIDGLEPTDKGGIFWATPYVTITFDEETTTSSDYADRLLNDDTMWSGIPQLPTALVNAGYEVHGATEFYCEEY